MAEPHRETGGESVHHGPARGASGWVVWIAIASLGLVVLGVFLVTQGIGAIIEDERFLLRDTEPWLDLDPRAWGWLHILVGIALVAAGFLVLAAKPWARAIGVVVAVLSALLGVALMSEHPLWGLAVVAVNVLVVVALTVHGSEIRPERDQA